MKECKVIGINGGSWVERQKDEMHSVVELVYASEILEKYLNAGFEVIQVIWHGENHPDSYTVFLQRESEEKFVEDTNFFKG